MSQTSAVPPPRPTAEPRQPEPRQPDQRQAEPRQTSDQPPSPPQARHRSAGTRARPSADKARRLPRTARRTFLTIHVTSSVGWFGLTLCLLVLSIAGAVGDSDTTAEAAYLSMKIFTDWLLLPLALLTLVSGLVLSLGTNWGLARHRWVWIKFWLTLGLITMSVLVFRQEVGVTAGDVAAGQPVHDPTSLIMPPVVSGSLYLFMIIISVFKPWGLTGRGRRLRSAGRTVSPSQ